MIYLGTPVPNWGDALDRLQGGALLKAGDCGRPFH